MYRSAWKMHRAATSLIVALGLSGAAAANADDSTRWVSDELSTYVRSGPTDGYRIVGTLTSGQRVEVVRTQGDYSQVRAESGDTVWIPTRDLQSQPGPRERLPALDKQVAELSAQLKTIDDSWKTRVQGMQETLDARKKLIDELQAARSSLDEQLTAAHSDLRDAQAQLGKEQQLVLMRYMAYGGVIAGSGVLLGLILPGLFRLKRKRNDQWV